VSTPTTEPNGGTVRPTRRELTLDVADLLRSMPGPGSSESERAAWVLRKELLLAEIEAVSR
jgi:hypothetical protein